MRKIPLFLIYLRLIIGFLLLGLSIIHIKHYEVIAISLFSLGLISDIFDGIIARKLNISTEKLRRLDSNIDQLFWCLIAVATFMQYPNFFINNVLSIIILITAEALTYLVCFIKFRKEVATHAISSKVWTLIMFATLIEVTWKGESTILFQLCLYVGLVTRLEIIAILLLLKKWTNDVPSVFHAVRLRQGLPINRHKMFNG